MSGWIIVLPVKEASRAKSRLGELRRGDGALARAIALDTIDAVRECSAVGRVVVVTDDGGLEASVPSDVEVIADREGRGPDAAIAAAMSMLAETAPRAALLADLPALRPGDLADALEAALGHPRAVVADAEERGSTLVTAAPGVRWASAFGRDSFEQHLSLGCEALPVPAGSSLRRDVDTPDHLAAAAELGLRGRTLAWWTAVGGDQPRGLSLTVDTRT
ncbi:2-phospho-L-lactate guanylyltransferase [Microbacterium sp. 4R-513]|uniref:2-phospho-L-lactate guanylyltransferase n=1 Tax=Microbacterium sp. 4R-513 TaxID=2567934 RepID=UPI0013E1ADB6|nr:2-phospho-L-lactate guanylyltransferase [Microbacterium sp. 4R-513]QIG39523.1 2-phospho-L-lactate guanylyltransferase [Microbacterium sp. 4R-513]